MGDVRAASYGHTLRGAVGLAMVHAGGIGKDGKPVVSEEEGSLGGGGGSGGGGGDGSSSGTGTGYRVVNKSFLATGRWEVCNKLQQPCTATHPLNTAAIILTRPFNTTTHTPSQYYPLNTITHPPPLILPPTHPLDTIPYTTLH